MFAKEIDVKKDMDTNTQYLTEDKQGLFSLDKLKYTYRKFVTLDSEGTYGEVKLMVSVNESMNNAGYNYKHTCINPVNDSQLTIKFNNVNDTGNKMYNS